MTIAGVGNSFPAGSNVSMTAGNGSPEGIVTAIVGSLWLQLDGINGEVLWRKTNGSGNTGWTSYGTIIGLFTALSGIALTGTLTIGADVNLYRNAANELKTDDALTVTGVMAALGAFTVGTTANITGDITAAGGFRQVIDNWTQENVAASQTNVELVRGRYRAIRAGSITGVIVTATEARTAGTLTVKVFKNTGLAGAAGAQLGTLTAVLDVSNTSKKITTQVKDTDSFAAGDELYLTVTTDAGWLPITADIRCALEIEH